MDEWGLEALELKAWMVILGTKIGENSNTHKLIGELGGLLVVLLYQILLIYIQFCIYLLLLLGPGHAEGVAGSLISFHLNVKKNSSGLLFIW